MQGVKHAVDRIRQHFNHAELSAVYVDALDPKSRLHDRSKHGMRCKLVQTFYRWNRMRETSASLVEKQFVSAALMDSLRVDGRETMDFRPVKVSLGPQLGQAQVQLGRTRSPKLTPESLPMCRAKSCVPRNLLQQKEASSSTQSARQSHLLFSNRNAHQKLKLIYLVCLNERYANQERLIRKVFALSLVKKYYFVFIEVWAVRVDIRVLDHEGNMLDCACLATMAALLHFKRPDVTVSGDDVTIVYLKLTTAFF